MTEVGARRGVDVTYRCVFHVQSTNPSLGVSGCCHSFFPQHTFGSLLLSCLLSCRLTPNGSISRLTSRRLRFQDKFGEWGEFVSPCCRASGDWNPPSACLTDCGSPLPVCVCVCVCVSVWGKPVAGSHADTQTLPPITYSVTAPRSTNSTPAQVRGDEKKEKHQSRTVKVEALGLMFMGYIRAIKHFKHSIYFPLQYMRLHWLTGSGFKT